MHIVAHIFHRDIRLDDLYSLNALQGETAHGTASQTTHERTTGSEGVLTQVIPVFFFTHTQTTQNTYRSTQAIQFMLLSLYDLDQELRTKGSRLHCFYGDYPTLLNKLHKYVDAISDTADYTPYALSRTNTISEWCKKHNKAFYQTHDMYINNPGTILSTSGKPYVKFTPFYNASLKIPVKKPHTARSLHFITRKIPGEVTLDEMQQLLIPNPLPISQHGGRSHALQILKSLPALLRSYSSQQDSPVGITSMLSAHNHFGTVSIREIYWAAHGHPGAEEFIRQLYWRDFYGHVNETYRDIVVSYKGRGGWDTDKLARWKEGRTGHPVVDNSMRMLTATGYIGNRARLIVGSYLVNELGLNWRLGAEHFTRTLVDIDYVQNMYNWLWLDGGFPFSQNPARRMRIEVQDEKYRRAVAEAEEAEEST